MDKPAAALAAMALFSASLAAPAAAGTLQVFVTTPDGKPAPDTVVVVLPQGSAPAAARVAEPVQIAQREIRFEPYVTAVPLGSTVRFVNRDRFDHHVRSVAGGPLGSIAPAKEFDFRLPAARGGKEPSADVTMDAPGAITVGCHLHGSMRAHVFVSPTPWVAVTDAAGRAQIAAAPEGATTLRLWHPDQLVAQPDQRVSLAAETTVESKLNFSPRRRSPSQRKSDYEK